MIELRNKRALVVGLARSGRAVAHRLAQEGALVTVTDLRPPSSFGPVLREMMDRNIGLELGVHREETFLKQDLIVVSPGVDWALPALDSARRKGVLVVPEVEAASWFFQCTLAGVTGTNGKTTTAALLGKMLEASGFKTYVAGNIGIPLISAAEQFTPDSIVVAELSSFQLEAVQTLHSHVAVLLNISENHLDRHRSFGAYVAAKAQIFRNQGPEDYAVLNADDPTVMSLAPAVASQKVFFSMEQDLPEGVLLSRGRILYRVGHLERTLFEASEIRLRGAFNIANVMAAAAAACVLGAEFKSVRQAVREFTGVEHRLEYVRTLRGVEFYNDSKATSVDATAKALSTFDRGLHLILGGKDKGAPYTPLRPLIESRAKGVYLIGEAAEKIAADLEGVSVIHAGSLRTALHMALARAIPGDVVLLSPACASFDQFQDFEDRGRAFKEMVNQLAEAFPPPAPEAPRAVSHDPHQEPRSHDALRASAPAIQAATPAEPRSEETATPEREPQRRIEWERRPAAEESRDAPQPSLGSVPAAARPEPAYVPEDPYLYETDAEEVAGSAFPEPDYNGAADAVFSPESVEPRGEPLSPYEVREDPGAPAEPRRQPTSRR
ncbi:MAG: UDP-N-acetylmuramoyl-L-alanine--D-glutamate ligase [Terriglobia bacterium]